MTKKEKKVYETPFKNIWHLTEDVQDGDDFYSAGFYFVDETQQLNGPYLTLLEANKALKNYIRFMN